MCVHATAVPGSSASRYAVTRSRILGGVRWHLLWKVPRKIGGFLNFKLLLLTRMGEALFKLLGR